MSIIIEELFPEVCNLFGDTGNMLSFAFRKPNISVPNLTTLLILLNMTSIWSTWVP